MFLTFAIFLGSSLPSGDYFEANRVPLGVLDRESNRNVVSVAATGMGMASLAVAVAEGRADRDEVASWIKGALAKTEAANAANRGWYYHFTDLEGRPVYDGEVSSVDTGLFLLGALQAALRLEDREVEATVRRLIAKVDQPWMLENGGAQPGKKFFSHGFRRFGGKLEFLSKDWGEERSEGVLLYRLFGKSYEPTDFPLDLPLFTYYYPLCFYRDPSWVELLGRAIAHQESKFGAFGFTSCDGPRGYASFDPDLVSPLAIASCRPFYPSHCDRALSKLGCGWEVPSLQRSTGWRSRDRIGIDEAAHVLLTRPLP